jgi:RNA polymerase sigma-70 factor (ECF subfamily)
VEEKDKTARFEQTVLPYMDAAYNLARWLTRNEHDAQDMVQEAYLRAFKFFNAFRGVDGRAWLLTIVRNTCYTWLHQNRAHEITTMVDEEIHSVDSDTSNPATLALRSADHQLLREALDELPVEFREVVVLRDWRASLKRNRCITVFLRARSCPAWHALGRLKQLVCNRLKEKR